MRRLCLNTEQANHAGIWIYLRLGRNNVRILTLLQSVIPLYIPTWKEAYHLPIPVPAMDQRGIPDVSDVLIVGAGPTGLVAALSIKHYNPSLSVTIVDALPERQPDSRGLVIHSATLEVRPVCSHKL